MSNDESPLAIKSTAFAVRITKMVKFLRANRGNLLFSIYDQVLRSGTSIMANIGETQFAQSKNDFASKLSIALKEAGETRKWLNVLHESGCLTDAECDSMQHDCSELIAMLVSSLNTIKAKIKSENNNSGK